MVEKQRATLQEPIIFIVDDDQSTRESLVLLLESMNFEAHAYDSAAAFLTRVEFDGPACLLLDIRLPGVSGLEFQGQLERMGNKMPIIFITGHGDIPMTVRAMKAGAVDFLTKPFRDQDILDAVSLAVERDRERRRLTAEVEAVASLARTLTPREREVMDAVVRGLMNKQIAHELGISEVTVKLHRGGVMRKMEARTIAELVQKAKTLFAGTSPPVT
jgi:FixJ family two-component response regulator